MPTTSINWPTSLPQAPVFENEGYVEALPQNLVISQQMSAGPPKSRPRSSAFYRAYTIPLVVKTDQQRDDFETFFTDTTSFGTQPFNWTGWVRKGSSVFRFDLSNNPPVTFAQLGNGVWTVTFNLLQYPDGTV